VFGVVKLLAQVKYEADDIVTLCNEDVFAIHL
jgi:hypothetical protein